MNLIDFISAEDQELYKAIIERAAEAKANAPKVATVRAPRTIAQQIKSTETQRIKLEAKLAELKAQG